MTVQPAQRERIAAAAVEYGLDLVLQFGSTVVPGREHPGSDLDLAVRFSERAGASSRWLDVAGALQSVFTDVEVDISVINGADPLHLWKICESCRLLYGDARALAELKMYAFRRYQDHRRFFAMERAWVARKLTETSR